MLPLKKPWMLPKQLTLLPLQQKLLPTKSNYSSKFGLNMLIHT